MEYLTSYGRIFIYINKIRKAKNVLEVSTSNGYSGCLAQQAVKETGGHLTTIEFWDKRLDIAKRTLRFVGLTM
ncbi:MAG: hypothetical protein ACLSA2_00140 [Candidatus Gastranaerophilaceae bacterium]